MHRAHNADRRVERDKSFPFPRHRFDAEKVAETHGIRAGMSHEDDAWSLVVHVPKRRESTRARAADVGKKVRQATNNSLMELEK